MALVYQYAVSQKIRLEIYTLYINRLLTRTNTLSSFHALFCLVAIGDGSHMRYKHFELANQNSPIAKRPLQLDNEWRGRNYRLQAGII